MSKIGLFGGTFDPIHYAHLFIGQLCADELGLDKVIYVPAGITPHKTGVVASPEQRYEMVEIAIADNPTFEISDYEVKKSTPSYSVDLVEHFKKLYPHDEIFFILGADSLDYIDEWYMAEELLKSCTFAVVVRGGFDFDVQAKINTLKENYSANVTQVNAPELEISSAEIRNMLKEGRSIKYLVEDSVIEYMSEHKIYI